MYAESLSDWYRKNVAQDWPEIRNEALAILQKEAELQEIVQLVGYDALPEPEKGILDIGRMIREDYLQQSAFDEVDTYCSIRKQYMILKSIIMFGKKELEAIKKGALASQVSSLPVKEKISRLKWIPEEKVEKLFTEIFTEMDEQFNNLIQQVLLQQ